MRVDTTPEVKRDFWKEYSTAAGVYTVGEIFNSNENYCASYQGSALDATLNYPIFWDLRDVFSNKKSMYTLRSRLDAIRAAYNDNSILGNFIDNHDNSRFLHLTDSHTLLKSALTYIHTLEGIPITYYGTEQYFNGDTDPNDREPLWPTKLEHTDMYNFLGQLNGARKNLKWWESPMLERWCDDTFYAFSRGDVLVALSNDDQNDSTRHITYSDYSAGTVLVNQFDESDTVTVGDDGSYDVTLVQGQPKIYSPQSAEVFLQE